jgi:hypothetical protein
MPGGVQAARTPAAGSDARGMGARAGVEGRPGRSTKESPGEPTSDRDARRRILLISVADHLDSSARVLTDIMNASSRGDISAEQRWANDLLTTSRLYRQDAIEEGEPSIASVLDDLERSLLEIVHSGSEASAPPSTGSRKAAASRKARSNADLDEIRRRIDGTALLFKVRVMSNELREREEAPDVTARPPTSTRKTS